MRTIGAVLVLTSTLLTGLPTSAQQATAVPQTSIGPRVNDPKLQDELNKESAKFYETHCKLYNAVAKAVEGDRGAANNLIEEARKSFSDVSSKLQDISKRTPPGGLPPGEGAQAERAKALLQVIGLSPPKEYRDALASLGSVISYGSVVLSEAKFGDVQSKNDASYERIRGVIQQVGAAFTAISVMTAAR